MKKSVVLLAVVVLFFAACSGGGKKKGPVQTQKEMLSGRVENHNKGEDKFPELTPEEHYHAIVNDSMTLQEVAKVNNIGLPFLKTKLGIPASLKYGYKLKTLKRNFRFSLDDLKTIIEDAKNRSAVLAKRRKHLK